MKSRVLIPLALAALGTLSTWAWNEIQKSLETVEKVPLVEKDLEESKRRIQENRDSIQSLIGLHLNKED